MDLPLETEEAFSSGGSIVDVALIISTKKVHVFRV